MDILVKRSTAKIVQRWAGSATKVPIPGTTTNKIVHVGGNPPKRPVDIGNGHVLIKATVVDELTDPATQVREPDAEVVDVQALTVVVTRPVRAKNTAELTVDVRAARARAYPPIGDQLDALWMQINQDRLDGKALNRATDDTLGAILAVKAARPKPSE